jgi:acetyl-CoA carboxylase biotin carboxyl carrier protein
MMKAKEIQELIDFIAKSGLDEVNIETEQFKISVKRNNLNTFQKPAEFLPATQPSTPVSAPLPFIPQPSACAQSASPVSSPTSDVSPESNYLTIRSPMIGTFYRSASPSAPVFVNVGDSIKKGQTVCIIEAMKLFNEIESEISGKLVKILVENASPVEYDQPLFLVDPS